MTRARRIGTAAAVAAAIAAPVIGSDATAGTPRCGARSLALSVKHDGGAAGTQLYTIRLRNEGRHSCKLAGYPGVSLLNARHQRIGGSAKRLEASQSHRFTLRPGQTGAAGFSAPTQDCGNGRTAPKSSFIRVIPPNTRSSLITKLHATACRLTVKPLRKSH